MLTLKRDMKNKIYLFVIVIGMLLIPTVLATCEEGQIDINSASLTELDEIPEIGPSIAQKIIDARPFETIDELIDVKWIGPTTLQKIKDDRIACISEEEEDEEPSEPQNPPEEKEEDEEEEDDDKGEEDEEEVEVKTTLDTPENLITSPPETIILDPKTIKSENDTKNKEEKFNVQNFLRNYSIHGFFIFCVLLAILLIIKRNKQNKNEFR